VAHPAAGAGMGDQRIDGLQPLRRTRAEAFSQAVEEALSSETTCVSRACDLKRQAEPPKRLTPSGVGSGDIDAWDVKAQEAAEGCAEYERPQEYRQYR
jgi:hypothetical protein